MAGLAQDYPSAQSTVRVTVGAEFVVPVPVLLETFPALSTPTIVKV